MKLNISRFFFFAVLAVLTAGLAKAEDTYTLPKDMIVPVGTEVFTLEIGLDNANPYTEGQLDLVLPPELGIVPYVEVDEDGYEESYVFNRTSRVPSSTSLAESNPSDGLYRLVFFNPKARPITGNEGTVFTCQIDTKNAPVGAYEIQLSKMELSSSTSGKVEPTTVTATLYITEMALTPSETTLLLNDKSQTLEVSVLPEDAPLDRTQLVWSSSDSKTVSVENGVITGLALGSATITAECQGMSATCKVTVDPVLPISISLPETLTILLDEKSVLTAEVLPANTTDPTLTWTSSAEDIVSVDAEGNITGLKLGSATITATANADNSVKAECVVTVTPVEASAITLSATELNVFIGSTTPALEVTFDPANTTDKTIAWSSSDEAVVSIAADGTITALALGQATITATTTNGVKAECTVKVNPILAEAITLSKTELSVFIGSTTPALNVTFNPANTTDKTIAWSSSDEAVVTVAEDGTITALALGEATITATATNGVKAECTVSVNPIMAEAITLSQDKLSILIGSTTEALTVTFDPEDTTDKTIVWTSSDDAVVAVNAEGTITAMALGTATITATTNNGKTATCEVTVMPIEVEAITMSQEEATILVDQSLTLTVVFTPENATFKDLEWTSSDEAVATVKDGVVTALAVGNATITATANKGVKAECVVTVDPVLASAITLSATELNVLLGSTTEPLTVTFAPANTTDKTIVWTSSDDAVVAIAADGTISAVALGEATITATTTNGVKAECTVKVNPIMAKALTLSKTELSVFIGSTTPALDVTFDPANTTDKTVVWSSSDKAVATVAEDGTINAVGLGSATITATATNGVKAECAITVNPIMAEAITLSQESLSIIIGSTSEAIVVTFDPADTTDKTITWSTSDSEVATVAEGIVNALGVGEATVTATTVNGKTATCGVTVLPIEVESVVLSQNEATILVDQTLNLTATILPEDATYKTLTWTSSDEAVATVVDGVVTALAVGKATVTATATNGVKAECVVTVDPVLATEITLSATELNVLLGSTTEPLEVTFTPANTTDKAIVWTSSDDAVVAIADDGTISADALGEATITATTTNGVKAECTVKVNPIMAESIALSKTELSVFIGSTTPALEVTFTPENTTDKTIVWSSSKQEVVTVAADGTLTAQALGKATIIATATNGVKAECTVTVNPILAETITLSQDKLSIIIGSTAEALTVTFDPANTTDQTIKWSTSDNAVVAVAEDGTMTAVNLGTATITATTTNGKTATCEVTVLPIDVESVTLSQTQATILVDESLNLTATIAPEDATFKTLAWTSSDEAVATVVDGVVTALAVGKVTITATANNGVKAECVVTVNPVLATEIALSATELNVFLGSTTEPLAVTFTPANTTDKTVVWTSSDDAVVAVAADGTISAVALGSATITATTTNDVKAQCVVTVNPIEANSIALSKTEASVLLGSTETLTVLFNPEDTTDKTVTWSSDNEAVATVEDGVVTALALGQATITATTVNGKTATCVVTVLPVEATALTLSQTTMSLVIGTTSEALTVTFDPENTTDKTLAWTSSDEAVATVAEGVVTAVSVGKATITVSATNGVKAQCEVTVLPIEANGITLSKTEVTMLIGSSETLTAQFDPADTTDKTLAWASDNEAVVTVADGVISAVGVGEATVTATTVNGKTATCVVTVLPIEANGIALSKVETTLYIGSTETLTAIFDPEDTTDKTLVWSSDNEAVVTVADGVITAVGVGQATVTATTVNGKTATCVVTVLPIEANGIALSKAETTLYIGSTETLTATFDPEDTTDKTLTWTSSDEAVVTVTDGVITAVSVGEATVTATTVNGKSASCVVTVLPIEANGIVLSKSAMTLVIGTTSDALTVTFDPEDTTDKTLTWTSSDEAVVTVADGVVTAVSVGEATITATTVNGKTATCVVTVLPIEANGIVLSKSETSLIIGMTQTLTALFDPEDTTDKTLTWTSSDEAVVTVADGVITAVGVGQATVTATTVNGKTATCVVTVLPIAANGIALSKTETTLYIGSTETLTAIFDPEDTTDKTLTWTSSDEAVVTVADGVITAVGVGQATVTATTVNGKTATCVVTVLPIEANGIALSKAETTLYIGSTETLTVTFDPEDTTEKTLTWTSSDEAVATVVDGVITAVGVGQATVTATTVNGKIATCVVTVLPIEANGIALSKAETTLYIGSTETLTAIFDPEDTTEKTLTWTSSDEAVATVSEGVVTAVGVGEATITVTTVNGKTATCVVTVLPIEANGIVLSKSEISLIIGMTDTLTALFDPEDTTDKTLTWTSSDEAVVTVIDGVITAVGVGEATVSATTVNGKTATCVVTVLPIEADAIVLSKAETTLIIGSSETLTVLFVPEDTTDKTLIWSSDNEAVVTVAGGVITAVGVGQATVTATTVNGKTATCGVTVLPIEVESITLSQTEVTLEVDEMVTLTATVSPADATYPTITWTSSDEDIAIVSEDGTVLAISGGTAVITASTDNGVYAECVVTVIYAEPVEMILSHTELDLTVGQTAQITVTFIPEDAKVDPIIWSSEDESVVTVVDGMITAVGEGSTDIVVTSGLMTATCHVVVYAPTSAIDKVQGHTGEIKIIERTIVVDTDALVTVCTSAGAVVYRGYDNTIEVGAAGLYLINVGNTTTKVIIR